MRTECLDWILIWNEKHLRKVLDAYVGHYNGARPHRGLSLEIPAPRPALIKGTGGGGIERTDVLGGLIYEYHRAA